MLNIYETYFQHQCPVCNNLTRYTYDTITLGYYNEYDYLQGAYKIKIDCIYCNTITFLVCQDHRATVWALAMHEIFKRGLDNGASISAGLTEDDIENMLGGKEKLSGYFSLPQTNVYNILYYPTAIKYFKASQLRNMVLSQGVKIYHTSEEELNTILANIINDDSLITLVKKREGY